MQFGNYSAINLFWAILGIAAFYLWAHRARSRLAEKFVQKNLFLFIADSFSAGKYWFKALVVLTACSLSVFALMRPQWGFKWEQVKRKGVDIFIALDVSKSMLTEDLKPNRLARSKLAILDMLKNVQGDRVGLIAFAGSAFVQCPLTADYNGFLLSLDEVNASTIPKGGTSISSAIRESLAGFEGGAKKYRALALISDGEDHDGGAEAAAKEAVRQGVKIYCVGVGSPEGELVTITDEAGNKAFLKDRQGRIVKSRLDEALLQKIALATGGSYVRAKGGEFGLDVLYNERISKLEKRELESKVRKRYYERFQFPLAIALLLLVLEPFVTERKGKAGV